MFREALEIIRKLWQGGYQSYRGEYLQLEDARVFDLPDELPPVLVAAGGPQAAKLAAKLGDGLFATDPDADLISAYGDAGGEGVKYCEVPLAWAADAGAAAKAAHELFRFGLLDWKVLPELQNPPNFESAASFVTEDHVSEAFACGPDVDRHLEVAKDYVEAGFDHLALINAGPDVDGFFDFFAGALAEPLRGLAVD